jgi:D-3-phosphoglycerate dehydrogenase
MINILRTDRWIHPIFDETLAENKAVALDIMPLLKADKTKAPQLELADIYLVPSTRTDIPERWQVTASLLSACPRLKVVSSTGSGVDTIDVDACTKAGVLVVNQAGGNVDSVAEHTMGLLLALSHRIAEADRSLRTGPRVSREALMGHEIAGLTLGLVGMGQVACRVAELATAFHMKVIATDPLLRDTTIKARGAIPVSMGELLDASDVISLHCPHRSATTHLFGDAQFERMKQGSWFLSTARGGIHDEAALYRSLLCGHLGGAGLDVWKPEPPPKDHPWLGLPNVVATYHTAGVTHEARKKMALIAARQILDICSARRPPRPINPEVWPTVLERLDAQR